jgi:hypothetical protein
MISSLTSLSLVSVCVLSDFWFRPKIPVKFPVRPEIQQEARPFIYVVGGEMVRPLTRVNSANVLDEGLRIGEKGHQMNSKVKVSQTRRDLVCIENKCGTQLAQSQSIPGRPLLTPIYRWSGLEELVGFNTTYIVCIRHHLIF